MNKQAEYDNLKNQVMACSRCDLGCDKVDGFNPRVMGQGNMNSRIMFMAEAPGKEETIHSQPLTTTGVSGKVYEGVLKELGLTRDEVYTTNVALCRPPRNRDPEPWEIKKCEPYFLKQLSIVEPDLIITFGRFAAQALLGKFKITKDHGQLRMSEKYNVPVFSMYHPAYIKSYASADKRQEFKDDVKHLKSIVREIMNG